ncbi:MAG: DUF3306 domain-containing protein [Silicimonas sp.]|nr:DUF3306 domain-containing protein [Silicimonas sp.]
MSDEDSVFSRWSRRKRQVVEEEKSVQKSDTPEPVAPADSEPETETEEEDVLLERLGLPVPETLKEGDDFSPFMADGVPQFLRKRALRVLWRSNPVLANLDGLNDYDDDFNSPELTQKVLATGYQVGKGFLREIVKPVLEENADPEPDEEDEPEEIETADSNSKDLDNPPVNTPEDPPDEEPGFRPRRMRFET